MFATEQDLYRVEIIGGGASGSVWLSIVAIAISGLTLASTLWIRHRDKARVRIEVEKSMGSNAYGYPVDAWAAIVTNVGRSGQTQLLEVHLGNRGEPTMSKRSIAKGGHHLPQVLGPGESLQFELASVEDPALLRRLCGDGKVYITARCGHHTKRIQWRGQTLTDAMEASGADKPAVPIRQQRAWDRAVQKRADAVTEAMRKRGIGGGPSRGSTDTENPREDQN